MSVATITETSTTVAPAVAVDTARPRRTPNPVLQSLTPLIVDAGVPLAAYYALKAAGLGTVSALAVSSALPALRVVWGLVKDRRVNGFAALILCVNAASIALSVVTGDPRLMLAKDSAVSSVVGVGILVSAFAGRPVMRNALKPAVVKNSVRHAAAWERLQAASPRFRRLERNFSLVWGVALTAECVVRIVGAYTVPVDTMVAAGTGVMVATMVLAFLVSGNRAVVPMRIMIGQEAAKSL
ncbi:VC0807 family protein [Streptomyces sp. NPDC087440]|uniref:VC0807 family protein n=1 Tax=Streptomyces sp. NPDC087440 TaxID=3365790 RepID=UPI0037FDCCA0